MSRPTTTKAWHTLTSLAAQRDTHSTVLSTLTLDACGIHTDFSRQHIPPAVLDSLLELANQQRVGASRDAQFRGDAINVTENQSVLHTALRSGRTVMVNDTDIQPLVQRQLEKMRWFADGVRAGRIRSITEQAFTDVVAIGIGGSSLGPQFACAALASLADGPRVHFVSNIDGAHLQDTLKPLNPATTLFLVTSKTFVTDETMTNARSAQQWAEASLGSAASDNADGNVLQRHFVAITAKPEEARRQGYSDDRIFEFWPWVGGRFSMWSAVGLPVALSAGFMQFEKLLAGARAMDEHFCSAPLPLNLPVLLALVGIWNRNFLQMTSHALLPYAYRLGYFPSYAQQLEMESNGKSVDLDGNQVDYATCPVIFGAAGSDSQHSFHQLLHQGTDIISSDIILVAKDESKFAGHHDKLLSNGIAQADAFWFGRSLDVARDAYRVHQGARPVSVLVLPELNAYYLGALIALYEHKVFVQGVIWNINSYDQWGVELGKTIAASLLPLVKGDAEDLTHGRSHLTALASLIRQMRARYTET